MTREPEIIVIREADEMLSLSLRLLPGGVDRDKERIVMFEIGFAGEAKTSVRIIGEAVEFWRLCLIRKFKSSPPFRLKHAEAASIASLLLSYDSAAEA